MPKQLLRRADLTAQSPTASINSYVIVGWAFNLNSTPTIHTSNQNSYYWINVQYQTNAQID